MNELAPKLRAPLIVPQRQSLNEKYNLVHIGTIETPQPAFLTLTESPDGSSDLYISGFSVFGGGSVSAVQNVSEKLASDPCLKADLITEKIDWPNEISPQPLSEAGADGRRLLAVPSGFLVPGRSTGAIYLMATNSPNPGNEETFGTVKITRDKPGWFYHRAEWFDVNGDGRLDLITARARVGLDGNKGGQMLWLEQPEQPLAEAWPEHPLETPGDVHFRLCDLNQDGKPEILSAQFFEKRIVHSGPGGEALVDDRLGSPFDLQVVDLNGDGKAEVLASNHEKGSGGKVVAYEVPDQLTSAWPRRTLLNNIQTEVASFNAAAPGQAQAFPVGEGVPWVLVSGDGSGKAHLLEPEGDGSYREHIVVDAKCTVGQSAVGDINGDGLPEIFVPLYERGRIEVFSMMARSGVTGE